MESHILNTYHQARFRSIGHKLIHTKSDSLSSESSNQNSSPEYSQISVEQHSSSKDGGERWCRDQNVNSSDDESSTLEEIMDIKENDVREETEDSKEELDDVLILNEVNVMNNNYIEVPHRFLDHNLSVEEHEIEDDSLVEGHDYDIITVYTVNPDAIDASSEDERDEGNTSVESEDGRECLNVQDNLSLIDANSPERDRLICQDNMDINIGSPVMSNIDEYFIKSNSTGYLLDTDAPIVKDIDEYFNKEKNKEPIRNVDASIQHKLPEEETEQKTHIPQPLSNNNEFLVKDKTLFNTQEIIKQEQDQNEDVSINESDLEVLPNIDEIKRYLLEDITYPKFRHIQKSSSVPHSPMQNICMNIDDVKTCSTFEDLNLDLSDLVLDNVKDEEIITKNDDIPRTLTDEDINSFLITDQTESKANIVYNEDDFNELDMEIERPLDSTIQAWPFSMHIDNSVINRTSTPITTVLDFCKEKHTIKKEFHESKGEPEDFVDVESYNDGIMPVLEANNVNSLLEQFEASEKLNNKKRLERTDDVKVMNYNKNTMVTGMKLQDAGVQLNKNKMRQILMPSKIDATLKQSPSNMVNDHDYCSSKTRHNRPKLNGGQSLLKPEVLCSNKKILNSRHRTCKNKKIVYHLSSDDEVDCNNSKMSKLTKSYDTDIKKKSSAKPSVKPPLQSDLRKKISSSHSVPKIINVKPNNSVMIESACKASDSKLSRNGSIKLTIKNKSEVILNCDYIVSEKDKHLKKCKNSVNDKSNIVIKQEKNIKDFVRNDKKIENILKTVNIKEEPHPKNEKSDKNAKTEIFYTKLFSNKKDVQIPQAMQSKTEKRPFEDELSKCIEIAIKKEHEPLQKKKKLNLQEYKLRRGVCSHNSSTTVSPEAIFPDMPIPKIDKTTKCLSVKMPHNNLENTTDKINKEQVFFDPIKEASRKILMHNKKQKAEVMRKSYEDIVKSKIPKVENLELQPLISDAEMMKIVGMPQPEQPKPMINEKPQLSADYEEIILVSIGTNTNDSMFTHNTQSEKAKHDSPTNDAKSHINFIIKKSDHVLKQNVFDNVKRDKNSSVDDQKRLQTKIDKDRYKDITATLKSVEKHVDSKISSNSLFASIQDVVMKKAPNKIIERSDNRQKSKSPIEKRSFKLVKTPIERHYDPNAEHGEDKVILHLEKTRTKPVLSNMITQTDSIPEIQSLTRSQDLPVKRKRNDSDLSMYSKCHIRKIEGKNIEDKKSSIRQERMDNHKKSRSKERFDSASKYRRRSRSMSRSRRRRSRSRSKSRSRGHYRRYRRSDSPYKRKRRSRSPYHRRRSPSIRREKHRSRSRSKLIETRPKSPIVKKAKLSPHNNGIIKPVISLTPPLPPLRKSTVSESSDSSTSSSSTSSSSSSSSTSSSSSSSASSERSRVAQGAYKREEAFKKICRGYNSSEDRENNTPVEERRIVFIGRLEKDITKAALRNQFCRFGHVMEVRLHTKDDGSRYGFVTYRRARDAWSAVEAASSFPQYDVGFGGRRAFCRQSYADLDGLEAKYTESAFHGQPAPSSRRNDEMSFEQMLSEMKKTLSQRKNEKNREDPKP